MLNRFDAAGRATALTLDTAAGPVTLRPETDADAGFLFALFRSHILTELAGLPVDDPTRERLAEMQFQAQTMTYRTNFPDARFDIVERQGIPIGRIVIDPGGETGCIVDFALMPDSRGQGLGSAVMIAALGLLAPLGRPVRSKVLIRNEPSLRMCLRAGFVRIEEMPPFLQLEWRPPV